MLSKLSQHDPQVPFMPLCGLGEDQYVVNEDDDTLVQLIHEYLVHHVREVRRGIRKTERYDSLSRSRVVS
jgi:hypothetical protein